MCLHSFDIIVYIDPFWETSGIHYLTSCSKCGSMVWISIRELRQEEDVMNSPISFQSLNHKNNKYFDMWFNPKNYPHLENKTLDEWKKAAYNVLEREMRYE